MNKEEKIYTSEERVQNTLVYVCDWFERGELPPVGIEIEAWYDDGRECWHKADVIGYSLQEERVLAVSLKGAHDRKLLWAHHFRPIRTDVDEFIDFIKSHRELTLEGLAEALVAAGVKPPKGAK